MKAIAIIPARSGSKGIKDMNIINVAGRPLLDYSIKAAVDSKCFDTVMVSTDSMDYADIAMKCGAEVPFLRTPDTSGDVSGTWDVVREVLKRYEAEGKKFDYVALLQPTSPLRTAEDIKGAFDLLHKKKARNIVSVTETAHPIQWCFPLGQDLSLKEYAENPYHTMRRQDLPKSFQENGAIYLVEANRIMEDDYDLYLDECFAYIMPRERSIDIDEEIDLIVLKGILEGAK